MLSFCGCGWWGGGVQSHFHVQPNCSVEVVLWFVVVGDETIFPLFETFFPLLPFICIQQGLVWGEKRGSGNWTLQAKMKRITRPLPCRNQGTQNKAGRQKWVLDDSNKKMDTTSLHFFLVIQSKFCFQTKNIKLWGPMLCITYLVSIFPWTHFVKRNFLECIFQNFHKQQELCLNPHS